MRFYKFTENDRFTHFETISKDLETNFGKYGFDWFFSSEDGLNNYVDGGNITQIVASDGSIYNPGANYFTFRKNDINFSGFPSIDLRTSSGLITGTPKTYDTSYTIIGVAFRNNPQTYNNIINGNGVIAYGSTTRNRGLGLYTGPGIEVYTTSVTMPTKSIFFINTSFIMMNEVLQTTSGTWTNAALPSLNVTGIGNQFNAGGVFVCLFALINSVLTEGEARSISKELNKKYEIY
jgi:hypothetical protein